VPNFEDCVELQGKIYFYDKQRNKVVLYVPTEIDLKDCPNYVLESFIKHKNFKNIED